MLKHLILLWRLHQTIRYLHSAQGRRMALSMTVVVEGGTSLRERQEEANVLQLPQPAPRTGCEVLLCEFGKPTRVWRGVDMSRALKAAINGLGAPLNLPIR